MGSPSIQKRQGWTAPSPPTPVRGPLRTWSEAGGVPVRSGQRGALGRAQASAPSRALSTSRAVARRAGPLASSLSFRAESRRLRARSAPSMISPARSRTPLAVALGAADQVQAVPHAVGEVDVRMTGRAEHHAVAGGAAAIGVGAGVVRAVVGLDLGEAQLDRTVRGACARGCGPAGRGRPPGRGGRRSPGSGAYGQGPRSWRPSVVPDGVLPWGGQRTPRLQG